MRGWRVEWEPEGPDAAPCSVECYDLIERKTDKGVDVVVVRQATTKTSGYHTKPVVGARLPSIAYSFSAST